MDQVSVLIVQAFYIGIQQLLYTYVESLDNKDRNLVQCYV